MSLKNNVLCSVVATVAILAAGCASVGGNSAKCGSATVHDGTLDIFPGEETIPILSWHCITPANISVEHYKELKECGFNLSFPHISRHEDALKALDCAAEAGGRVLLLSSDLHKEPEKIVPQVMNHPGLAGYHLRDEPLKDAIPGLKKLNDAIRRIDPNHFTYLNLLPSIVSPDALGMSYTEYIDYCSTEVVTPLISYDCYGIVNNTLRPTYYENLELFAAASKKMGKPFWAFALTTAHGPYPVPNAAQLKFQMYSNLAYGAQGLQYFTYWNPPTNRWDFHEAPILENGKRSSVYDIVREVNAELQKRNFVFMHSQVLWTRHTGATLPTGTTRLETTDFPAFLKKLDTHGKDAVVSLLEKNGTSYLVIVNGSFTEPLSLTTEFAPGVTRIRKDGTSVDADEYADTLTVPPGECEVFAWNKQKED